MSDLLNAIRQLITTGDVRISEHGYDELAEDGLTVKELLDGIDEAQIIRIIQKEGVYYFCKMINMAIPFMYVGNTQRI